MHAPLRREVSRNLYQAACGAHKSNLNGVAAAGRIERFATLTR
jgi:hypothetical protein